ncbi:metallophosphoesterase [Rubrivirga sp.]|uniref:metallophosphoesterase n=1 Tax=Rubrivirga sp. TaxID=1885344 RepID=UPI003B5237CE
MRTALAVFALVLVGLLVYGVFVEPRLLLDDEAFEAELPNLRPGWDGKTIALMADFQIGMWLGNTGMVEEAVEDAIDDSVSLALIAGDFLYRPDSARVRRAVALVRPLVEAGIPTVAVLGNHDYSLMKESSAVVTVFAEYLTQELEAIGVRVLENEATPVVAGGDTLWVAGVGSNWAGRADVPAALAAVPAGAPRLWLMHNSEAFRDIPGEEAHLALAAHTHGGQVRVFPGERTSWLDIVRRGEVAADGWAADSIGAPPNRIYINRGIGFSTVPVRINCRPELTEITLRIPDGPVPSVGPGAVDVTDS